MCHFEGSSNFKFDIMTEIKESVIVTDGKNLKIINWIRFLITFGSNISIIHMALMSLVFCLFLKSVLGRNKIKSFIC